MKEPTEESTKSPPKDSKVRSPPKVMTIPASPYESPDTEEVLTPPSETSPMPTVSVASATTSPLPSPKALRTKLPLASLAKPPFPMSFAGALKGRNARHSIDVKALPSYLAKKRQSTFGQFLSALSPSAPEHSSSSDEPLFEEPTAPTLSLGERIAWVKTSGPEFGAVKWIGRVPQICNEWTVGVEFDNCIGTGDGTLEGRRYFISKENFAKFLPLSALTKVDNYIGRPRTGTMLSRMSVQLKPGQLISVQRSPSVHIQHCSLNAPHHVGHDVHVANTQHCLCPSCNHPCAHLCKTRKPKGRRTDMAHMCHFSSKPHAKMCCGGEDLACAAQPITHTGISWLHNYDMASLRTVPVTKVQHTSPKSEYLEPRRKSVTIHDDRKAISAPTSVERDRTDDPSLIASTSKNKNGSNLSISSLPSSGSPAEVYIARGVLTDESDVDTDSEKSHNRNISGLTKLRIRGLRTLAACFATHDPTLEKPKKKKHRNNRRKERLKRRGRKTVKKITTFSSDESPYKTHKSHRRGLSTDTSLDGDMTHCSHCHTTQSAASSKVHTNLSPTQTQHKSTSTSPPPNSPIICSDCNSTADRSTCGPIAEDVSDNETNGDGYGTGNGNENEGDSGGSFSRNSGNGNVITTKADIESTLTHRSHSSPSQSTASDSVSPRRPKKGQAPPPPSVNTSPSSLNLSASSSSLPLSPVNGGSSAFNTIKRRSYKKHPVPTPPVPNLTRSMSEQKQLNLKNLINAVPSFRSEVDLKGETRKSLSSFANGLDTNANANQNKLLGNGNVIVANSEVPLNAANAVIVANNTAKDFNTSDNAPQINNANNTDNYSNKTLTNNTDDSLWSEMANIGRIMEDLEVSIAHGEHRKASALAKELALRKVTCTLNRSPTIPITLTQPIIAYLYIEDKETLEGPIPFQVYPSMTVNMLKLKVEKEFNIPTDLQRWVLGKSSATNSDASLATYGITSSGCSIFLYRNKHIDTEKLTPNNSIDNNFDEKFNELNNDSSHSVTTTEANTLL